MTAASWSTWATNERGEYMYKWVSAEPYVEGGDTSRLMVDGTLHVAVFNDDLSGEWVPLTPGTTGMSAAEIAVFTRMAGSAVNATTMDRPEWVAVNPTAPEAYCCLTNNSRRGLINEDGSIRTNAGGEPMIPNGAQPARAEQLRSDRALAARGRRPRGDHLRVGPLRDGRQPDRA